MGCAFIQGKAIGKKANFFNIEMAELGAEARGMTPDKLFKEIPALLEAKRHMKPVDFITQWETSLLLDYPMPFFYRHVKPPHKQNSMIVCGSGIVACAFCGRVADFRCDYPIGNGRTCDLPICIEHKTHRPDIGSDIDYCPHHQSSKIAQKSIEQRR